MTGVIQIAAEAERPDEARAGIVSRQQAGEQSSGDVPDNLPVHQFPATVEDSPEIVRQTWHERQAAAEDRERERRTYRRRVVAMLRRFMRYSIETGRLPSLLGREFFREKVTSYTVVTFEDRVIFVHDMERCMDRLDEFSRQLIRGTFCKGTIDGQQRSYCTAMKRRCGDARLRFWTC
jgi:hypothetical protein